MYELYTVNQFKAAWFNKDHSVISEEDFDTVYTEYVDTTGLYKSADFEKVCYIHFINNRINTIKLFIRYQKDFLEEFGFPYVNSFEMIQTKYGHTLNWYNDKVKFLESLRKLEMKEKKYISVVNGKIKELQESREKDAKDNENEEEPSPKKLRERFIRTVNSLGKVGYKIDGDKTTVEELALMIVQQIEEVESHNKQLQNNG